MLIGYHHLAAPDTGRLVDALPGIAARHPVSFAVVFCLLNPVFEEYVFRGLLFESFKSAKGQRFALIATSVRFGVAHLHGYPPGIAGVMLAGGFGALLGLLKERTGGLAMPILVHVVADATIMILLLDR